MFIEKLYAVFAFCLSVSHVSKEQYSVLIVKQIWL